MAVSARPLVTACNFSMAEGIEGSFCAGGQPGRKGLDRRRACRRQFALAGNIRRPESWWVLPSHSKNRTAQVLVTVVVLVMTAASLAALGAWHARNVLPNGHDAHLHFQKTTELVAATGQGPRALFAMARDQPARYPLLVHALAAGWLVSADFAPWGIAATALTFWLLLLAGAAWLGAEAGDKPALRLLVFAAAPANPILWRAAMAFNLELALAASFAVLAAMVLWLGRAEGRGAVAAAVAAAIVLAQAKPIILIPLAPGALVLAVWGLREARLRRAVWLVALTASAGAWLALHWRTVAAELGTDYTGVFAEASPESFFYARSLLFSGRGLGLVVAAAVLLVLRAQARKFTAREAGLAAMVLAPVAFFAALQTQREWYLLTAYLALAALTAALARSEWERRGVRRAMTALAVATAVSALVNIGAVLWVTASTTDHGRTWGMPHPAPFPGLARQEVAEQARSGLRALARGDVVGAEPYYELFVATSGQDNNARLGAARAAAERGDLAEARRDWDIVAATGTFGSRLQMLDTVAELEARAMAPPDWFDRYFQVVAAGDGLNRDQQYSLGSLHVRVLNQRGDRRAALAVLLETRQAASEARRPGMDLQEAQLRAALDQHDRAVELLTGLLAGLSADEPLRFDAGLALAQVRLEQGALAEAEMLLVAMNPTREQHQGLALTAMALAGKLAATGRAAQAEHALRAVTAKLRGQPLALVEIERAKLAWESDEFAAAKAALCRAAGAAEDQATADWVRESLRELDRVAGVGYCAR
jgi:hypothetical protein